MGRGRRSLLPGFPVHVTQRGNNRQAIFRCDADFRYLWRCLRESVDDGCVDIHAYVFMENHIHLLVTPNALDAVAKVMQSATRRYAGYFNTRYQRTGTLWEGRYRASRILTQEHFLACHRYIDLNPVRAGLATLPEDYAWSSHRLYALGEANSLIHPHKVVVQLLADSNNPFAAYRQLFEGPMDHEELELIRVCTQASRDMGDVPKKGRPRKMYLAPFF